MWREEADRTNLSILLSSFLIQERHTCMNTLFTVHLCVCFSERQNHARELMREADLSQWDALVIMSGDGLLFEVKRDIRSLYSRPNTNTVWLYVSVCNITNFCHHHKPKCFLLLCIKLSIINCKIIIKMYQRQMK